jgi:hypothetical protein
MAVDASILNEEEQQVQQAGPQQIQEAPMAPQDAQGAAQGGGSSTIQAGQAGTPSQASQNRRTPSSGSFTNIRKYIKANKPFTRRLGESAGQVLTDQASKVGEAIKDKQQVYQDQVASQQQARMQAKTGALDVLRRAQETGQVDAGQAGNFRQLATGAKKFNVGEFDLGESATRAQELEKRAEQAVTAQGRRDLLRTAFAQPGRQYTRGQQSLDNLLLQTSDTGTSALQQAAQSSAGQVKTAREQALADAAARAEEFRAGGIASGLQQQADTARQQLANEIEQRRIQAQKERDAVAEKFRTGQIGAEDLQRVLGNQGTTALVQEARSLADRLNPYTQAMDLAQSIGIQDVLSRPGRAGEGPIMRAEFGEQLLNELSRATQNISNRDLALLGMSRQQMQDMIAGDIAMGAGAQMDLGQIAGRFGELQRKAQAVSEADIARNLASQLSGADLSQYFTPEQVEAAEVLSPELQQRYAAVSQLAGRQIEDDYRRAAASGPGYGQFDVQRYLQSIATPNVGGDRWRGIREI